MSLASYNVFQYLCEECLNCYTGETRRHLGTRINEHIKGQPVPTEITRHFHVADDKNVVIILKTNDTWIAEKICNENVQKQSPNDHDSSIPPQVF